MSATTVTTPASQEWFVQLDPAEQVRFLLYVAHELTIIARYFYVPQTDELTDPGAVRYVNEIQHRVAAHALDILADPAAGEHPPAYGCLTDCPPQYRLSGLVDGAVSRAASYLRPEGRS